MSIVQRSTGEDEERTEEARRIISLLYIEMLKKNGKSEM
jgi:hypothetical protein